MMNTPNTVPISMPPAAAVPIVLLPNFPGPEANINGINPAMKAKEVIKIGRKRILAPSNVALYMDIPSLCRCDANSTYQHGIFPNNPISITMAICA